MTESKSVAACQWGGEEMGWEGGITAGHETFGSPGNSCIFTAESVAQIRTCQDLWTVSSLQSVKCMSVSTKLFLKNTQLR